MRQPGSAAGFCVPAKVLQGAKCWIILQKKPNGIQLELPLRSSVPEQQAGLLVLEEDQAVS